MVSGAMRGAVLTIGFAVLLAGIAGEVSAETRVFVRNNTQYELRVEKTVASGSAINPKVKNAGVEVIPSGERGLVLTLSRIGKVNWMDLTPRALEPGKSYVFSTGLRLSGAPQTASLELRQRLKGTGKSSRMWFSVAGTVDPQPWHSDEEIHQARWRIAPDKALQIRYGTQPGETDADIEYVIEAGE